jgi:hypothetical protein
MCLTPSELRSRESALFQKLEDLPDDSTFRGRLYRDGVPTPEAYLNQRVRVVFVFREPNFKGEQPAHDMRDEVSDVRFRPRRPGGGREERSPKGWWNGRAGLFAHAVDAALGGESLEAAMGRFSREEWRHAVVNRFAYVQIKKIGGGGTSNAAEICEHARKYGWVLREQLALYRPHLVLGCGLGQHSPASLLAGHVLPGGRKGYLPMTRSVWWRFGDTARPQALIELWHPARRGLTSELYRDVWSSVRELLTQTSLTT